MGDNEQLNNDQTPSENGGQQLIPVKVAVRVRPLSEKEKLENAAPCLKFPEENQVVLGKDRAFTYDYVFPPDATQDQIYKDCVEPLVRYCFQGYHSTILAYGQTGAGKTHTMGTNGSKQVPPEQLGLIPRVIKTIFAHLGNSQTIKFKVSFLELYNEEIRDMLNPETDKPLNIREDSSGVYVTNLKEEQVKTQEEMEQTLVRGSLYRTVGSTQMNTESSRSHAIFTIIIEKHDPNDPSNVITSRLHFVDLAGSERLSRTKAEGARMKEGISINGGLLALGNVISALGDPKRKTKHVPYRDSKLTRILQDSLGGNSRTLMIACCSPSDTNLEETLNTLKYADRARQIKNKPIVNVDPIKLELLKLRKQVVELTRELLKYKESEVTSTPVPATQTPTKNFSKQESFDRLVVINLEDKVRQLSNENEELNHSLNRSEQKYMLLMNKCIDLQQKYEQASATKDEVERDIHNEISRLIVEGEDGSTSPIPKIDLSRHAIDSYRSQINEIDDDLGEDQGSNNYRYEDLILYNQEDDNLLSKADELLNTTTTFSMDDFANLDLGPEFTEQLVKLVHK